MWMLFCVLLNFEGVDKQALLPGAGWSWVQLDLELDLSKATQLQVTGKGRLQLQGEATRQITFMLNSRGKGMTLHEIEIAGHSITELHHDIAAGREDGARLVGLFLDKEVAEGTELMVTFTCQSSASSMQLVLRDDMAYASWVEAWYPVPILDKVDLGFGKQVRIKGKSTFQLPSGWRALTNGHRTEYDAVNFRESWEDEQGLARSFVAGPFTINEQEANGKKLGVYLLSPKPLSATKQAKRLGQAIDALSESFGAYPFNTFAIAEIPNDIQNFGAASEQGFIVAKSLFFEAEDGNLPLFAHEAGHSWWGNVVTTEGGGGDKWCSESLAQYGAYLAIEAVEGPNEARRFMHFSSPSYVPSQCGRGYFGLIRMGHDLPLSESINDHWSHQLADSKGHWVYHMLRHQIGDDLFFETLKSLFIDYQSKPVSMDLIRAYFVSRAPDNDLETFFAQWLDRTGAPIIQMDWRLFDELVQSPWNESEKVMSYFLKGDSQSGGSHNRLPLKVEIQLSQIQLGDVYQLPLELGVWTSQGDIEYHQVVLSQRSQHFEIEVSDYPIRIEIDPNAKQLIWRPAYGKMPEVISATDSGSDHL